MEVNEPTVCIVGPVEDVNGSHLLRIPLDLGGEDLAKLVVGISKIEDGFLIVAIPNKIVELLKLHVGSRVVVDNANGKFNITRDDSDE